MTEEERDFPIAYSLVTFKDIAMLERLVRAIYRPQNVYCFHVDKKSSDEYFRAVSGIASCLQHGVMTAHRVDVR